MKLSTNCSICNRPLSLLSTVELDSGEKIHEYKCGHAFVESPKQIKYFPGAVETFSGDKRAYEFQIEGLQFFYNQDYNGLCGDPMGLGKTVQAALLAREFVKEHEGSVLILVKGSTIWQWLKELKEWFDPLPLGIFMIQGSKGIVPPGFKTYLCSMDTLARFVKVKENKDFYTTRSKTLFGAGAREDVEIDPQIKALNIQMLICDESHSFKNPESKRSAALVHCIEQMNIKHKLFLSGTPIKNRAEEYFVPLNLLRPEIFTSLKRFRSDWLVQDANGRYSRINPYRYEEFQKILSEFVIRREKTQVLKNLPPFRRSFDTVLIEDEALKAAYNKELEKLRELSDAKADLGFFEVEENLMTLRRITGLAKCEFAVEAIEEFLDSTENEKCTIGIHHKAVRDRLRYALEQKGIQCLVLSGEDTAERKNKIVEKFTNDPQIRVLICSVLAGGVGLNLQVCNNALVLERQWNAADEEQFEGRFYRDGQRLPVNSQYMLAKGTIDEYFSAMVESKRKICGETLDGWTFTQDAGALRELVETTIQHRL